MRQIVVVPHLPGPVSSLAAEGRGRGPDDLDWLIDELFPEVDGGPGWFDVGLVVAGAGLLVWAVADDAPPFVLVLGLVVFGLGCILPLRTAWRRVTDRTHRRRRDALLARGVPVDASAPSMTRLLNAYEGLLQLEVAHDDRDPAVAASHGAVLEAASLLGGRVPSSDPETEYVEKRAAAIEILALALRKAGRSNSGSEEVAAGLDPASVLQAREELDQIAGFNSISRLEALTVEAEIRRRRDG